MLLFVRWEIALEGLLLWDGMVLAQVAAVLGLGPSRLIIWFLSHGFRLQVTTTIGLVIPLVLYLLLLII